MGLTSSAPGVGRLGRWWFALGSGVPLCSLDWARTCSTGKACLFCEAGLMLILQDMFSPRAHYALLGHAMCHVPWPDMA